MMSKEEADEIGALYNIDKDVALAGVVFVDMPATLEALIAAYDAADWDGKSKWWEKASKIVPHLWD